MDKKPAQHKSVTTVTTSEWYLTAEEIEELLFKHFESSENLKAGVEMEARFDMYGAGLVRGVTVRRKVTERTSTGEGS